MNTVCIIQDRIGNSRLRGKSLYDLGGKPMTARILERVKRASRLDKIVHAPPVSQENDVLEGLAREAGVDVYRFAGDENDLFARYLEIAGKYRAEIVVRISADNPCVDPRVIDETIDAYMSGPAIFLSSHDWYRVPWKGVDVILDGVGCEVFSYNRLQWLSAYATRHHLDREQPHRAAIHAGVLSRLSGHSIASDVSNHIISLDVDRNCDYPILRDIYTNLYPKNPLFTTHDLLAYLDTQEKS